MQILYFGWVRARIGVSGEKLTPPPDVANVAELITWLKERGGGYAEAFADVAGIRAAVNHEIADLDAAIADGDEVALFPPMTGG